MARFIIPNEAEESRMPRFAGPGGYATPSQEE